MKRTYFGTDGVRGPYGGPVINLDFAGRLGEAAGLWARRQHPTGGRVLIGRDTRASGEPLLAAVAAGLVAAGLEPVTLGVVPTPAVAQLVRQSGAILGVVITASHNPATDNGIKFFTAGGIKLTDEEEAAIEQLLPVLPPKPVGPVAFIDAEEAYVELARALLPERALEGWRIVLDTANGATCVTSRRVLRSLGAEVWGIGDAPNGDNINDGVGSEHPERMAALVRASSARLGIAHDGDGDRCVLCDETGVVLDGDEILTLLAVHALNRGVLARHTLVVTVQSNLGVDAAVRAAGGHVVRTFVGDRYVGESMRATGAMLGGESSGHVIHAEVSPSGDGLVAALKVINVMLETGQPLSALRRLLVKFPQVGTALRVREKTDLAQCRNLNTAIAALEAGLGSRGRVLVRYSGTEPKLRFLVEGPDEPTVTAGLAALTAAARQDLDVQD
ncbi:MAG: phosphoglucosamine mutase [Opitutaceae bacterium]|nr:phosphoglucosamine mutase [Opitutaceae bacterium]